MPPMPSIRMMLDELEGVGARTIRFISMTIREKNEKEKEEGEGEGEGEGEEEEEEEEKTPRHRRTQRPAASNPPPAPANPASASKQRMTSKRVLLEAWKHSGLHVSAVALGLVNAVYASRDRLGRIYRRITKVEMYGVMARVGALQKKHHPKDARGRN